MMRIPNNVGWRESVVGIRPCAVRTLLLGNTLVRQCFHSWSAVPHGLPCALLPYALLRLWLLTRHIPRNRMRLQGVYMRFFTAAAILSLISSLLFGQAGTGTITGVVTDPAGAVIANASVEVRNTENNAPYPTVTTQTGAYTVPNLPPGPYTLTVRAPDFKRLVRAGLTVAAGQTIPVDVGLEVGAASESVTVQAEPSLLKTETGDMSHNITLEQLDDLPVLGIGTNNAESLGIRNPFNSVVFLPGVSYTANFNMIVNGAPTNTAAYRIEGLDAANHVTPPNNFAIQQGQPSADAVQEMAIQTSNYAPEFGQAGGGLFNIT
jgi:hypothetical protein